MKAGSLEVELFANVARLAADMDKAKSMVGGAMSTIEKSVSVAKAALIGLGALGIAAGFAKMVRGAIDAADETTKLAQKTGLATKEVAGLQLAFRQAGAGDAFATSLARLSKGLADGNDGLKAMGISTKNTDGTLKSARQAIGEVADKFESYRDGAEKSALAQQVFGKAGADLIPLLNAGGQALSDYDAMALKLGLTLDTETTKQAEKFNDTLDLVSQAGQGVARQVAAQLLPTLSGLADQFFTSMTEGDKLKKMSDFLATGLKGLYVVALGVVEVFTSVGKVVGGSLAAIGAALTGDFSGALGILKEMKQDVGAGWKDTLGQMQKAWGATGSAALEATATMRSGLKGVAPVVQDAVKGVKAVADEFGKLRDKINGKDSGTDADFIQNLMLLKQGFDSGRVSMAEYLALADKYVAQQKYSVDAAKATEEAQKALNKTLEEYAEANEKGVADAVQAAVEAEKKLATYGMLESAVQSLTLAHLVESRELAALAGEDVSYIEKRIAAQQRLIAATTGLESREVAEKQFKALNDESTKFYDSIYNGLTDSLYRGFESGKGFFRTFWDGIKNLFKTTVLKLAVQGVMGMTGLGGLSGAANASTGSGGGILGMASNASSLYSAGSSLVTIGSQVAAGSMSLANALGTVAANATGTGISGLLATNGAFGTAAGSSTGVMGALMTNPVGWIALAAIAAYAVFAKEGGGPKTEVGEGYLIDGASGRTWNDPAAKVITDSIEKSYGDLAKTLGLLDNTLTTGIVISKDPLGDSKTILNVTAGMDGQQLYTRGARLGGTENVGRTDAELQAAIADEYPRIMLDALKASKLPEVFKNFLYTVSSGDDVAKIQAAIDATVQQYQAVVQFGFALDRLPFQTLADLTIEATAEMIRAGGGLEAFSVNLASYFDNFYSDAEKRAQAVKNITGSLNSAGGNFTEEGIGSLDRGGYRAAVEKALADFGPNSPLYQALLAVSGSFAQITPAATAAKTAVEVVVEAVEVISETMRNLTQEGASLAADLLRAQGDTVGAAAAQRAIATAGFTAGETALYDYNAALREQISTLDKATEKANAIASERTGLQDQLNDLTDTSAQAIERQRNALDESNRGIFDQIQAYNALKVSIEKARIDAAALATSLQKAFENAKSGADGAMAGVQRAIDAEKQRVSVIRDAASESVSSIKGVFTLLRDEIEQLYGTVDSTRAMQASQGNQFIDQALNNAKTTGYLPDAQELSKAIAAARGGLDANQFSTQFEADKAALIMAGKLSQISDIAGPQLTAAEQSLKLAEDQLAALDKQLEYAQNQVDALNGVNTSVLSVADAITALGFALSAQRMAMTEAARPAAAAFASNVPDGYNSGEANPQSVREAAIAAIYSSTLGRVADTSGLAFYASGTQTIAEIASSIAASTEATVRALGVAYQNEFNAQVNAAIGTGYSIPAFAVGTNYVPKDMLAMIHEGEQIVPKAYNPAAGGMGNDRLERLVEGLTAEVQRLQNAVAIGNENTRRTATAVNGNPDVPMLVQTV